MDSESSPLPENFSEKVSNSESSQALTPIIDASQRLRRQNEAVGEFFALDLSPLTFSLTLTVFFSLFPFSDSFKTLISVLQDKQLNNLYAAGTMFWKGMAGSKTDFTDSGSIGEFLYFFVVFVVAEVRCFRVCAGQV